MVLAVGCIVAFAIFEGMVLLFHGERSNACALIKERATSIVKAEMVRANEKNLLDDQQSGSESTSGPGAEERDSERKLDAVRPGQIRPRAGKVDRRGAAEFRSVGFAHRMRRGIPEWPTKASTYFPFDSA